MNHDEIELSIEQRNSDKIDRKLKRKRNSKMKRRDNNGYDLTGSRKTVRQNLKQLRLQPY